MEDHQKIAKHQWLKRNKGILKRIASNVGVSASFVSDVYAGKRHSFMNQVEEALIRAGAPGVERGTKR
jgi:predicted XRE-type DNA-binding protein